MWILKINPKTGEKSPVRLCDVLEDQLVDDTFMWRKLKRDGGVYYVCFVHEQEIGFIPIECPKIDTENYNFRGVMLRRKHTLKEMMKDIQDRWTKYHSA